MRDEARARRREGVGAVAVQAARMGRGRLEGWGVQRARAERTKNMLVMVVTLDVSKLSGWLNADARCQVKCRAYDAGRGVEREARGRGGGSGASGARGEGPT